MLSFFIVRHAESVGNVNHHLVGGRSNHFPLTERGRKQAHSLGKRFHGEARHFDEVYASVALRAQETAQISTSYLSIPQKKIILTDDIVEISQGDWEGQVRKEVYNEEMRAKLLADNYNFKAPGGESQREVEERMEAWFNQRINEWDGETNKSIGVYSHGFAIKSYLRRVMGADYLMTLRTVIHNTSITVLQYNKRGFLLERVNDHQHIIGNDFVGHYG
ncbi:MAG: histidine phosphatase family protein [Bacteroidia bacterium]|nr:histidine phosphatase family protein [Bacteroidia bacterium]